jgi:chromosomal replication initiation ATPase DnaA
MALCAYTAWSASCTTHTLRRLHHRSQPVVVSSDAPSMVWVVVTARIARRRRQRLHSARHLHMGVRVRVLRHMGVRVRAETRAARTGDASPHQN